MIKIIFIYLFCGIKVKRAFRSYDVKISLFKKSIGQQFINYLGTKYNSMRFSIKKNIYTNYKHNKIKKIIGEWLFKSLNIT